jgi:hypothetical protein
VFFTLLLSNTALLEKVNEPAETEKETEPFKPMDTTTCRTNGFGGTHQSDIGGPDLVVAGSIEQEGFF